MVVTPKLALGTAGLVLPPRSSSWPGASPASVRNLWGTSRRAAASWDMQEWWPGWPEDRRRGCWRKALTVSGERTSYRAFFIPRLALNTG